MARVTFWEKPGCAGNALQKRLLEASGHVLDVRNLLSEPWTAERLGRFFADLPPAAWFNRASPRVRSGEIVPEALDRDAAMAALLADPLLIRRPLMVADGQPMVGFETDDVAARIGLLSNQPVGEGCARAPAHPRPAGGRPPETAAPVRG
jgi:nitrogenase-associated protein